MTPQKSRPARVASVPRVPTLALLAAVLLVLPAAARAQPTFTLFTPGSTPAVASVTNDFSAVELGVKFRSDVEGDILGIRFFKGATNTGTHVGSLWSATGQRLAFATFTSETATGWQQVLFSTPVRISANTTYVASYHAPNGAYAFNNGGLAASHDAPPLHALAGPSNGGNGVFTYGAAGSFPATAFGNSNYWVDVVFRPAEPVTLWPSNPTPPVASVTNDSSAVELGVKFKTNITGDVLGVRFYKGAANTGTHVGSLWSANGQRLAFATFTGETATGWQQVLFSTPVTIAADTTYIASYHAPVGAYAFEQGGLSTGQDTPPLFALPGATSGGNGVFAYGAAGSFPVNSFENSNYWVDVVFQATGAPPPTQPQDDAYRIFPPNALPANATSTETLPVELGVKFRSDVDGQVKGVRFYKGAGNNGTHVGNLWSATGLNLATATFTNETAVGWQEVTFSSPVAITAGTTYVASYFAPLGGYSFNNNGLANGVDAPPLHALPGATTSGGNGVYTYASASTFPTGSHQNTNYWVDVIFESYGPPPRPGVQGAGPVLVATAPGNPFTDYLREILEAEGIASFATTDAGNLGVSVSLNDYKVLILGEQTLGAAQVTLITNWVNAGGSLIALRPAANLQSLLGLNASQGTLSNGYILVNATQAPGTGITAETMQYHGPADRRTVTTGTRTVATLYSDAATATTYTAISQRTVGSGTATAFMYDLAKSVVLTRQGNPAWQGQNRDGSTIGPGARANDMFYGNAAFDPQPDWVNMDKVQIPQADEQQRLLANVLHQTSSVPLPRLWYFPRSHKAVVVMTGDGHPSGLTTTRWNQYLADSAPGCSVADWECIRGTVYDYVGGLTATQANSYVAQGFEYALHVNTGCADYTANTLDPAFFTPQLAGFAQAYPLVPAPTTNRTHCIAFSDWSTQPKVSRLHGIRLDTNYYYWPHEWVLNRPGLFTGTGLAMRFADLDGTPLDVYQLATQLTDESGQTLSAHIDTLLANALGTKGYYAAINANMHVDSHSSVGTAGSATIIAAAKRDGVPVITARQLLDWVDAREATQVSSLAFSGTQLTFNVINPARNLSLMVPTRAANGRNLTSVTRAGAPVTTVIRTIKGVSFAFVDAAPAGTYTATYN
ncbi:protein of unknown function [Myxococcus fulvus]|uniref:DUF4082 domain-containing protein n=1 Tax=Myxococcus fulvus TaxID=33 RepID=A0A511SVV4_MYXFU|nr:DUF4082 domain-containing protein [Myxococcus fulvus]GEN06030.1 hypothetical protein MFU01_10670 [Myxococcus fulvus]SET60351.1 protein of unknown function [Myxococcus fulvus]